MRGRDRTRATGSTTWTELLALVATLVVIAAPPGLLVRLAARVRSRGPSGGGPSI